MVATDEDALICDLAETYHILDFRRLNARYVATLAAGLRANSRILTLLSGNSLDFEQTMLISMYDQLNQLIWIKSRENGSRSPRPKRVLDSLKSSEVTGFKSAEEFERAKEKIIGG